MREAKIGAFRLKVLGGFALDGDPAAPAALKRRAEAVLAVLAVSGEIGCSRERLVALLWPESDESAARHGLRDALHALRRELGSDAIPAAGRLLRLDPAVVACDIHAFTQSLATDKAAEAVRLYGGPLLDGFHLDDAAEFERWLDGERARVAREYGEALKRLATGAEREADWGAAVGWWARAVEHDPLNSHLVLQQVRVLAGMGDRAGAIRVAEGHARRLREEYDLEPDREILATIERIRRGEVSPLPAGAPPASPPLEAPTKAEQPRAPESQPIAVAVKRVSHWIPWAAAVTVLVLGGAFAAARHPSRRPLAPGPATSIAVLPFRNLGGDSSHAYFADGLHDELMTQLAKVASLRVVGRTSVMGYEATAKPLRQVAEELAVGSIVEAGVQVIGNRLRVNVQLLDPVTEQLLWSERYDRTLDDAFAVESDIAQRVVTAVGGTLTSAEEKAIASPTPNAGAYDFYLQGLEYLRRPGYLRDNLATSQHLFERSIALDSAFAPAHAALATAHLTIYAWCFDRTRTWVELAGREVAVALRLTPGLPEAHFAAALRDHIAERDTEALAQLELARRVAPNDAESWLWTGFIQRKLGNWDQSFAALEQARRIDPRNANLPHIIGDTYHYLRRYGDAVEWYRRAAALAPDLAQPRLSMGWSYFLWQGRLDTLKAVLNSLPLVGDPGEGGDSYAEQRMVVLFWERKPDSLLALIDVVRKAEQATDSAGTRSFLDPTAHRVLWAGEAHRLRGDSAAARAAFDSAAVLLAGAQRGDPDNWLLHAGRGMALAGEGRRTEALKEAAWLERYDARHPNKYESGIEYSRARILSRLGETDAALDLIERQLAGPSLLSVYEFEVNPEFDPVRKNPRYAKLVQTYERGA